jgi:hypothetical protein
LHDEAFTLQQHYSPSWHCDDIKSVSAVAFAICRLLETNEEHGRHRAAGGFCNWGPAGTGASSVCEEERKGEWLPPGGSNCDSSCGGRWCTVSGGGSSRSPHPHRTHYTCSGSPVVSAGWGPSRHRCSSVCEEERKVSLLAQVRSNCDSVVVAAGAGVAFLPTQPTPVPEPARPSARVVFCSYRGPAGTELRLPSAREEPGRIGATRSNCDSGCGGRFGADKRAFLPRNLPVPPPFSSGWFLQLGSAGTGASFVCEGRSARREVSAVAATATPVVAAGARLAAVPLQPAPVPGHCSASSSSSPSSSTRTCPWNCFRKKPW